MKVILIFHICQKLEIKINAEKIVCSFNHATSCSHVVVAAIVDLKCCNEYQQDLVLKND